MICGVPLRAVIGFGQVILETNRDRLSNETREYLARMRAACIRMDQLIRDVLSYGVLVRSELPLHPVNISELLHGIIKTYPDFQPPKAEISVSTDLPSVRGNEAALTQCFSNLLQNAVRFAGPDRVPQVRIWSERIDERVRISVEDNGVGIPQSMQERIFGLFQRGSNSGQGTGVGLAIVRKAAERMGGRVGVISEPGHGSRFWVELHSAN